MFFRVKVKYTCNPTATGMLLVRAQNEYHAIEKVIEDCRSYGISIEIISINKSTCCGFLGHTETSYLYVCKIEFIGSNMEYSKRRNFAIGANDISEVCGIVKDAFEETSYIKHYLLSERQLRSIEYRDEINYIDYVIRSIVELDMDYIN